jgi:hypothetical protein
VAICGAVSSAIGRGRVLKMQARGKKKREIFKKF